MNLNKNCCLNCGKSGHQSKKCSEPVISNGIICFNYNTNINNKKIEDFFYNKFIDINEYNYENLNNIKLIPLFYDKIKIMMICRKHSLNYVGFLRGQYDPDDINNLQRLFSLMSVEENLSIRNKSFNVLWNDLWKETASKKMFQKELNASKSKFEKLKSNNFYNLLDNNNLSKYNDPEWGFPKGRRDIDETNMECASREFYEETNISLESDNILILERVGTIEETYIGTNNIKYKHNYFLVSSQGDCTLELVNNDDFINANNETSNIKWFTIPEALEKIRPYEESKIQLIHQIYFFLINLLVNISSDNKIDLISNN